MRTMMPSAALCLLLLSACAGSRNDAAADACQTAIAAKLGNKTFAIDRKDMMRTAKDESADVVVIASAIVVDTGLSTEYAQTFDSRGRFENGKAPSVIGMQFNWSKDDLKKATSGSG